MHPELYSDGVGEITVSGTVVRVDLVSLSPTERDAAGNPKPVLRQRLIFSVEGFANSVEVMQKALQGLVEAGAVTRGPARQPGGTAPPGPDRLRAVADAPRPPNVSPNFR
jgi:hypothetical protein